MTQGDRKMRKIEVNMNSDLLELVEEEVDRLDTDISTYVRWCIRSGLYLKDLNSFVRSKKVERK